MWYSATSFLWPTTLCSIANAKMSTGIIGGGENLVFMCTDINKQREVWETSNKFIAQKFYSNNSITFSESVAHLAGVGVKKGTLFSVLAEVIETDKAIFTLKQVQFLRGRTKGTLTCHSEKRTIFLSAQTSLALLQRAVTFQENTWLTLVHTTLFF